MVEKDGDSRDIVQGSLTVNKSKCICCIYKESCMSIIILKNGPHSMNSSFRTSIMTSTCLRSPRRQMNIIANHMKDSFCNYLPRNIANSCRPNFQFLFKGINWHGMKAISSAESTSSTHRRQATAAKPLYRVPEAEPKEKNYLHHV